MQRALRTRIMRAHDAARHSRHARHEDHAAPLRGFHEGHAELCEEVGGAAVGTPGCFEGFDGDRGYACRSGDRGGGSGVVDEDEG
jgi:hypothetical protein